MSLKVSGAKVCLPLLYAAAHKKFDVKVVNPKTGKESPFDLGKTVPGCHLNIRWKDDGDSLSTSSPFPNLKFGDPGVRQHCNILYLDPASIAFEMHSVLVTTACPPEIREAETTKLIRGGWLYIVAGGVLEHAPSIVVEDFSDLNFFWCMILHFHRTGECLPVREAIWGEHFQSLLHRIIRAAEDPSKPRRTDLMTMILREDARHRFGAAIAKQCKNEAEANAIFRDPKKSQEIYETMVRNNVDFVDPPVATRRPTWWTTLNDYWSSTLQYFIKDGKAPCPYAMKAAGGGGMSHQKGKNNNGCVNEASGRCPFDHTLIVLLVNQIRQVVASPFQVQMRIPLASTLPDTNEKIRLQDRQNVSSGLSLGDRQNNLKNTGNEFTQKQDYSTAIKYYDAAIELCPEVEAVAAIYSNRSLCHLHKSNFAQALSDADKCIKLRPTWFRGHFRRGCALEKLSKFEEAIAAFDEVIKLEPTEAEVVDEFKTRCSAALLSPSNKGTTKSTPAVAGKDTNGNDDDEDYETVEAMFIAPVPNVQSYNVKIPVDFVKHADQIHKLLGISDKDVKSLEEFLLTKDTRQTQEPHQLQPARGVTTLYTMRDWIKDQREERNSSSSPASHSLISFGFQPLEFLSGFGQNMSDLILLTNPQSCGPVNLGVCGSATATRTSNVLLGGNKDINRNPSSALCRGDGLLVRIDGPMESGITRFRDCSKAQKINKEIVQAVAKKRGCDEKSIYVETAVIMNVLLMQKSGGLKAAEIGAE